MDIFIILSSQNKQPAAHGAERPPGGAAAAGFLLILISPSRAGPTASRVGPSRAPGGRIYMRLAAKMFVTSHTFPQDNK